MHTAHFMTPETKNTCQYFWSVGRNFKIDNDQVTAAMTEEFTKIFSEDVAIVEAQQKSLDAATGWLQTDVNLDAPILQARQILDRRIAAEENA